MSDASIQWYSTSLDLAAEQRGPISLPDALTLVDEYLAHAGGDYQSVEEAIAATMFGFLRSETDFIEICVHDATRISYSFEMANPNASWLRRLFGGVFQYEAELHSREELIKKVEEFFSTPVQEIKRRLESL
jgi:hypothetical protein